MISSTIIYHTSIYQPRGKHPWWDVIWIIKLFMNDSALLSQLEGLSIQSKSRRNRSKSLLNCSIQDSSEPDEVELMILTADYFITFFTKSTTLNALLFILPGSLRMLSCVRCTCSLLPRGISPSCSSCHKVAMPGPFLPIVQTVVFNNMQFISCDPNDNSRHWE